MHDVAAYLGLFGTGFAAATLLPMQSEAVLMTLVATNRYSLVGLLIAASAGNVLGSFLNWWLGRYIEHFKTRRWFPVRPEQLESAVRWYRKYGHWSLLLSLVPVIGDPLTVVAGVLRERWWSFLILVTLAKAGRYVAVILAILYWTDQ